MVDCRQAGMWASRDAGMWSSSLTHVHRLSVLHAATSTASHRRANAAQVDTIPGCNVVVVVVFELPQNREQLLFAAHLAIRQFITVVKVSRKIQNCFWAPNTYSCSIIHMCCAIFSRKIAKMNSLKQNRSEHPLEYTKHRMHCLTSASCHLPSPTNVFLHAIFSLTGSSGN